jgi:hypothetical protein
LRTRLTTIQRKTTKRSALDAAVIREFHGAK